ncbi:MAG: hypothetical protein PHC88_06880 [Terrimicrobiaceae bacterium]|nr:hypothetical protein [Terrimicrobiaceae bacterium]
MNLGKSSLLCIIAIVLAGCQGQIFPTLTPEERAVLDFNINGVKIGGRPGQLAVFPQVRHIPIKLGGCEVYEVYNATPNISEIKAWYFNDKLVRIELRYFNGPGTTTLARSGGWDGLRDYLMHKFGPPSRFGADVPIVATKGSWKVEYAKFNGEWIFSRIKRQINYSAMADARGGIGVITVMDTTPIVTPKPVVAPTPARAARVSPTPSRVPEEVVTRAPNPGF